jgi:3-deoxy-D-manno-octulosonic-acid transferase
MIFLYDSLIYILGAILFWIPNIEYRKRFERKNLKEKGSRSFKLDGIKADLAFEFSSEGEYQQIASLVEDALLEHKKIELVFFSPSVERAVLEVFEKNPDQIRYLRYPILTFGFREWITADHLTLVRYDFFPEFLFWARDPLHHLSIIWVSFKRERVKHASISRFKKLFLKKAINVVYASEADQIVGVKLGHEGPVYDFRMEQIQRRLLKRDEKFQKQFPQYQDFKKVIEHYPREKRVIIGNAWPSDLPLLKNIPKDYLLVIVPHQLHPEILKTFHQELKRLGRDVQEIQDATIRIENTSSFIVNKKGILCELYADFGKAYVGGGFETSIHSVLEPLVSGADAISSGPLHHRSTEFDLAMKLGDMSEVKNNQDFLSWLDRVVGKNKEHDKLKEVLDSYNEAKGKLFSC